MEDENMIILITNSPLFLLFADVLLYIIENRNLIEIVFQYKNLTGLSDWTRRRGFPGRRSQETTWKTARRTG